MGANPKEWARGWTAVLAVVGMGWGCEGSPGPPASAEWDSAGVHVVESASPAWRTDEAWSVAEPSLVIEGASSGEFYGIVGGALLPDGRAAVADGGSSEVRTFDRSGRFLGSSGGRGEGPGEFLLIQAMGPAGGDSVWVYDFALARVTVLASDGSPARTLPLSPPLPAAVMVGRRSDGVFVVAQMWGTGSGSEPLVEGLVREPAAVVSYDGNGILLDTLALVLGREVVHRLEGGRMTMATAPFARTASHALLGDDLVVGDQAAYEVRVVPPGGGLLRVMRWAGPSLTIRDGDAQAWREEQVASVPSADRASVRAQLAAAPVPARRPAFGRVLSDPSGRLWVAAYANPGQDPRRWEVLGADGRWLGSVELPPRFRPLALGADEMLGVARDDLDVERLEVRPIRRGGS